jgi:uncharacterized membrane protein
MAVSHQSVDMYPVHHVPVTRPFVWLGEAWDDLLHHRGASLAYGWLVAALGALILAYQRHPAYLAATITAFLLVGPVITAGLCELSRLRDHGEPTSFQASLHGLTRNRRNILYFAGTLLGIALVWFALSAFMLYAATGTLFPSIESTVGGDVLRTLSDTQVAVYALAFTTLALVVFALSVVTVPMIIDRHVDAGTAMRMSLRVTFRDFPAAMLWALLITGLVLAGFATWLLGMIVIFPLLGHATWFAYRDAVEEA